MPRVENYFNYFTEVEECFQRCRGTRTLLSPLDWALIEAWKEAGIPLDAVLAGIERSFEKFQKRPRKYRTVNSVAYCTQEVMRAAEEMADPAASGNHSKGGIERPEAPPFTEEEIAKFFATNAAALEKALQAAREDGQSVLAEDLAAVLEALKIWAKGPGDAATGDLQELEGRLTAMEDKLTASLTRAASVELLARLRQEVERGLAPYRRKMTAAQIDSLERQFLKKRLFEHFRVPRLSLFYL